MSLPVISVAQMREWERATWTTGQTEQAVIAQVGEALAWPANRANRRGELTLIIAGKGHNGDDARALVPHLHPGRTVLLEVIDPVVGVRDFLDLLRAERPSLIIDGLFGVGLSRPLDGAWQKLIIAVNDAGAPILSVDVPSGLNADTGEPMPVAIRATETSAVGAPKRGLLASAAAEYVGRLRVLTNVGLVPCPCESQLQWTEANDFAAFPPVRPVGGHKGTFGHVALVAGSLGFHGASVLAARGAQRARPGLITLFTQPDVYGPAAGQLQAVMVQIWKKALDFANFSSVLFGPGLAAENLPDSVREMLRTSWRSAPVPIVVDASALAWLEPSLDSASGTRVITPHPGEAARLLNCAVGEVQRDRVSALRALSRRFSNCWVVLKGRHTLVGRAEGNVFVNGSGSASLAQAGTGDLLAGFIAGLLAQPEFQRDVLTAQRYAVWEHAAAAERLDERRQAWVVEELATELGG